MKTKEMEELEKSWIEEGNKVDPRLGKKREMMIKWKEKNLPNGLFPELPIEDFEDDFK